MLKCKFGVANKVADAISCIGCFLWTMLVEVQVLTRSKSHSSCLDCSLFDTKLLDGNYKHHVDSIIHDG